MMTRIVSGLPHFACKDRGRAGRSRPAVRSVIIALIAIGVTPLASVAQVLPLASPAPPPLHVVTLFTVLTEIATDVGGPDVEVRGLLPPGVDPHTFEPAPGAMRALADADLVLASGLGLESYLDKLAANSGTHGTIVAVGDGLRDRPPDADGRSSPSSPPTELRRGEFRADARELDPHWWNSVAAAKQVVREVAAAMAAQRPAAAAGFRARADLLVARLDALDAWTRIQFAGLPLERRQLVTTHDAFGWFARDYGFTVHPISGLSPEADPDARDFARLAELIRSQHIPAVFIEDSENSKLAAALAREAGVRLGGTLYPDGLVPDKDGSTYEAMFRHNVLTIVAGLK
jgi:zinc/manganese transport system substrate-binding protein